MLVAYLDKYEPKHCQKVGHIEYQQDNFEEFEAVIDLKLLPDQILINLWVARLLRTFLNFVLDISFEVFSYPFHDLIDIKKAKTFNNTEALNRKKPLEALRAVEI